MSSKEIQDLMMQIEDQIAHIQDPKEALEEYYGLIYEYGYLEIFANHRNLKSDEFQGVLRQRLRRNSFSEIDEMVEYIVKRSHFNRICDRYDTPQNVLVVNDRMKFTFTNNTKPGHETLLLEGKRKMRREYGTEWTDEDETAETKLSFVC